MMAVSGEAVPAIEVWLKDGKLSVGYNTHANGAVVEGDPAECFRRISRGERVLLHRYGLKFVDLKRMVEGRK